MESPSIEEEMLAKLVNVIHDHIDDIDKHVERLKDGVTVSPDILYHIVYLILDIFQKD